MRFKQRALRTWLVVMIGLLAVNAAWADPRTVDLRDPAALQQLRHDDPAHFAKIQLILDELARQPQLAQGDWLRTEFHASDVELSQLLLKTSYPPRQRLQFTLDDTRYILHVVRTDLVARPEVLR